MPATRHGLHVLGPSSDSSGHLGARGLLHSGRQTDKHYKRGRWWFEANLMMLPLFLHLFQESLNDFQPAALQHAKSEQDQPQARSEAGNKSLMHSGTTDGDMTRGYPRGGRMWPIMEVARHDDSAG
jgi:hypothetical protein